LAIPSALSQGAVSWLGSGGLFGWDFLTLNNNIWGNYSLSIGAILICLFVGWKWGVPKALVAIEQGGFSLPAPALWAFLVRYFCPLAILAVLIFIIVTNQYF
jgi:NSS family neurotransmitter:Na+ symporter